MHERVRSPYPVAALLRRAEDGRTPEERHQAAYWAWEASVRLLVAARPPETEAAATALLRATLGEWVGAARPPERRLRDRAILDAYEWLVRHGGGGSGTAGAITARRLLDALPPFRNRRIGHGAAPVREVYDADRGARVLREGLAAAWREGVFWPTVARLVHVESVELGPDGQRRGRVHDLTGEVPRVLPPEATSDLPAAVVSGHLYARIEDAYADLSPWIVLNASDLRPRIHFFNGAGRSAVHYLDLVTGEELTGAALPAGAPADRAALLSALAASARSAVPAASWPSESALRRFVQRRRATVGLTAGVGLGLVVALVAFLPDATDQALAAAKTATGQGAFRDAWNILARADDAEGEPARISSARADLRRRWAREAIAEARRLQQQGALEEAVRSLDEVADPLADDLEFENAYLDLIGQQAPYDTLTSLEMLSSSLAFQADDTVTNEIAQRARRRLKCSPGNVDLLVQIGLLYIVRDEASDGLAFLEAHSRTASNDVRVEELRALLTLERLVKEKAETFDLYRAAATRAESGKGDHTQVPVRCLRAYRILRMSSLSELAATEERRAELRSTASSLLEPLRSVARVHYFVETLSAILAFEAGDHRTARQTYQRLLIHAQHSNRLATSARLVVAALHERAAITEEEDDDDLLRLAVQNTKTVLDEEPRLVQYLTRALLPLHASAVVQDWVGKVLRSPLITRTSLPDAAWQLACVHVQQEYEAVGEFLSVLADTEPDIAQKRAAVAPRVEALRTFATEWMGVTADAASSTAVECHRNVSIWRIWLDVHEAWTFVRTHRALDTRSTELLRSAVDAVANSGIDRDSEAVLWLANGLARGLLAAHSAQADVTDVEEARRSVEEALSLDRPALESGSKDALEMDAIYKELSNCHKLITGRQAVRNLR